ncbi:hypothetical protein LINPERHAP1_LOCUS31 [Linum perenne]
MNFLRYYHRSEFLPVRVRTGAELQMGRCGLKMMAQPIVWFGFFINYYHYYYFGVSVLLMIHVILLLFCWGVFAHHFSGNSCYHDT